MRVVIFSPATPAIGGVGEYSRNVLPPLLSQLRACGCDAVVLLSHDSTFRCEPYGGRGIHLPNARHNRVLAVALENLYSWALGWGTDVFVSLQSVFPLTPLLARRTLAVVHDLRQLSDDPYIRSLGQNVPGSSERHWTMCLARTIRRADRIVAVSDFVVRELRSLGGVPPRRIRRIYLGLDHNRFRPTTDRRAKEIVRTRYQLPNQFYIFVGGVTRGWKNLELIAKAYSSSGGKDGLCLPVVITSQRPRSPQGYRALELIEENHLGYLFQFVGHIAHDDLPIAYSMAKALIFPSHYEGFGVPPLEAMACGTPVIASNRTALPEVIADAGILIEPSSPGSLLAAIRMLSDPTVREEKIKRGLSRASLFSNEKTAAQLADEILNLATHEKQQTAE